MRLARRLYHLARADFLERARRHGFLVTLLFCVYAGYAFLPPNPGKYATLVMESHRGVYNSAWVGTAVAMLSAAFLSLIGFFLVKNAIERDRHTRVGQILATTPVSRVQYTLGKTLSNFTVLAAMTLVVATACIVMQLLRGEDRSIDLYQIFAPFVLITLPALMVTAALAVWFETLPVLRGGMGNVAFIFLWGFLLGGNFDRDFDRPRNDPLGTGVAMPSMLAACQEAFPDFDPADAGVSMGVNVKGEGEWLLTTFTWEGVDWTAQNVTWRLSWVLLGLALGAAAAIPFDRFDPSRGRAERAPGARRHARAPRVGSLIHSRRRVAGGGAPAQRHALVPDAASDVRLTPLPAAARGNRFGALVLAEWKLIVRGLRWWYAGPLAVIIASFTAPLAGVRAVVLPLAWFWPVLLWSKLGTREARHQTEDVLFSAPRPLARQLAATWIAGALLAVLAAWPVAVRFLIAGDRNALAAWCVGAAFIPALALALGVWTRSGKFFEALYTGLCYAVLQSAAPLDFMGAIPAATEGGYALVYAAITAGLLLAAVAGRRRRLLR